MPPPVSNGSDRPSNHGLLREALMRTFDVQSIELGVAPQRAFDFIADPGHLPLWAEAFASADRTSALLRTPGGAVPISLATDAVAGAGTVDWHMTFPDGTVAHAHSRV